MLNLLLITLDPFLANIRKTPKKKAKKFGTEVLNFLRQSDIFHISDSD